MKLSEAIRLGSTVMSAKAGIVHAQDGSGCALGMAAIAMGYGFSIAEGPFVRESNSAEAFGLWLNAGFPRPCSIWCWPVPRRLPAKQIITHLFDVHVIQKLDWTLDDLADWVASIEPSAAPESAREGTPQTLVSEQSPMAKSR